MAANPSSKASTHRPEGLEKGVAFRGLYFAANAQDLADGSAPSLFALATGAWQFGLIDDLASACVFQEAANAYLTFVTSNGTEAVKVSKTLDVDGAFDFDGATFDVVSAGVFSIDGTGASNVSATSGNLTLSTITTGAVNITAADDINILATGSDVDIDAATLTADLTGAISIDGVGASNLTVDSGALTISTTTTGAIDITAADDINIAAAGSDVDIDGQTMTVDMTGAVSIDCVGASNFTVDNGNFTLTTNTAGEVIIDGVGGIDIDTANSMAVDVLGNFAQDVAGTMDFVAADATSFETAAIVGLNAAGATALMDIQTGDRNLTDALGSPASGALTIHTGDSTVDNGAGAATGGVSGAIILQSGDTNCADATGTAGASGAVTIQTGDADSDAGTSGDSGILTLVTGFSDDAASGNVVIGSGNADTDSGTVYIDVGAAGGTAGNVNIGTTATLIELEAKTHFTAAGGAVSASGLLAGAGTTGNPATTAVAGSNMLEFRVQTTATSDDFRGFRLDADFNGIGVSGDAIRGRALITAAGTGGTVDGGAFTVEYNGGSVTGSAVGCRSNVVFPNATVTGGTIYGGESEFWLGGTSFVNNTSAYALHLFNVSGGDAGTRNAQVLNLFEVAGVTSTTGGMYYNNTGGAPANSNGSLRIMTPDGAMWIMLYNQQAA